MNRKSKLGHTFWSFLLLLNILDNESVCYVFIAWLSAILDEIFTIYYQFDFANEAI